MLGTVMKIDVTLITLMKLNVTLYINNRVSVMLDSMQGDVTLGTVMEADAKAEY